MIKIGDMVTSYWNGYYEVVKIDRRWENKWYADEYQKRAYSIIGEFDPEKCGEEFEPLVHVIQKFTGDGKPINGKAIRMCCASCCRPMYQDIEKQIEKHNKVIEQLTAILYE